MRTVDDPKTANPLGPPLRPAPPPPAKPDEFILTPVEGKPHLRRDQHGRLHNVTPTPCYLCGGRGGLCLLCGRV